MSTTFEVIPIETCDVTFKQVVELSELRINSFLQNIENGLKIKLNVNLHENAEKYVNEIDLESKFEWKENEYVWFSINGIAGGTDVYYDEIRDSEIDPKNPWWRFDDMISNNKTIENLDEKILKAKTLNRYWWFRRSARQTAIINLAYGLIGASVAELTKGFIWTDDGAWNYKKFPAEPLEFDKWYFKPDSEEDKDSSDWAKECIGYLKEEIKAANNV